METRYGKQAYDGYGKSVSWRTFDNRPMPIWEALPEKIQNAWDDAARAAIHAKECGNLTDEPTT